MWVQSKARPPNYSKKEDEVLRSHGRPDMILVIKGHKLHVHSQIIKTYTNAFLQAFVNPDPYYGRQFVISSAPPGRLPRSKAGVVALLNAIYPPRLLPPLELLREVHDIAREYGMDLLIQKLRAGVLKNSDVGTLKLAERLDALPELLLDVFAEFAAEDLEALPGYDELQESTKASVAERREIRAEQHRQSDLAELWSGVGQRSHGKADCRALYAWPPERLKRTWLAAAAAPGGAAGRCGAGGWTTTQLLSTSPQTPAPPSRPRSAPCSPAAAARDRRLSTGGAGGFQQMGTWKI